MAGSVTGGLDSGSDNMDETLYAATVVVPANNGVVVVQLLLLAITDAAVP